MNYSPNAEEVSGIRFDFDGQHSVSIGYKTGQTYAAREFFLNWLAG
jgi:hypothetical protein